ncbi:MAG TPA: redoxin domain-containing protein [Pirellulales bacterium]|jgi:thiol-disulfide isomerase/thioredoxin
MKCLAWRPWLRRPLVSLAFIFLCVSTIGLRWQSANGDDPKPTDPAAAAPAEKPADDARKDAAKKDDAPPPPPADAKVSPARFLCALDTAGQPHFVGNGEGYRASVLVFMTTECPISREYVPTLNKLAAALKDQPVKFYGVITDSSCTRAAAAAFQKEFKIEFPLLFDASGELAETLGAKHVPEAFVLNAEADVVYSGRIDDLYAETGKKRSAVTKSDLAEAIAAVVAGKPVDVAKTEAVGCPIEAKAPGDKTAKPTFNRDIAPILFAKCAECHRPGEVAPFALLTYSDAAKRADFLAQVTHSRKMPPWRAEIGHVAFLGERRLSDRQIALIETWAKEGAPEGAAEDLPQAPQFASGWRLGKPDVEIKIPHPFTVPAGGEDIFQHFVLPLNLDDDKEIVGWEFRAGNAAVVHHAIIFLDTSGVGRRKDEETPEPGYRTSGSIGIPVAGIVGVWTPGMTPQFFPQNIGLPVSKRADVVVQLHLHPSGKEEVDQSSIALYFAKKPVDRRMAGAPLVIGSLMIDIPAGSKDYSITSSVTLPLDVTLISLLPHMHLVGKEMRLTATLPDGEVKQLVWIKDWNFYWQDNYVYRDPVKLPTGTRLDIVSKYDNSEDNALNPSKPPQRVLFGNDSTDEMCFGIFQVVAERRSDEQKIGMALMQSAFKQWVDSPIDAEGRKHILEEAGKLFGTDASNLSGLLRGGGLNRPGGFGGRGGFGRSGDRDRGGERGRRDGDKSDDKKPDDKKPEGGVKIVVPG